MQNKRRIYLICAIFIGLLVAMSTLWFFVAHNTKWIIVENDTKLMVKGTSSMREIQIALKRYLDSHEGKYPDRLEDIQNLSPEMFRHPITGDLTGYIYHKPGPELNKPIAVVEDTITIPGHRIVLYSDYLITTEKN